MASILESINKSLGNLLPARKAVQPPIDVSDIINVADQMGIKITNPRDNPKDWVVVPKDLTDDELKSIYSVLGKIDTQSLATADNRSSRLASYARMDASGGEGGVVLDTYADETLIPFDTLEKSLSIKISDQKIMDKVNLVFAQNDVFANLRANVRAACKYGDGMWVLFPKNLLAQEIVDTNPKGLSGIDKVDAPLRPEDIQIRFFTAPEYELEGAGNKIFQMKLVRGVSKSVEGISHFRDDKKYFPWEYSPMTLRDAETFPYGRSILEGMRLPFEKKAVIETLLAATRANKMDRIAVSIPNVNTADPASALASLSHVKNMLKTVVLSNNSGSNGRSTRNQDWAMTEYLFIPDDFKVQKLATSLDFGSTDDAEYFRDQVITASRLPKSYFLADNTDARPGNLAQQDKKFARALNPIAEAIQDSIKRLVVLCAFYLGADLSTLEVEVELKRSPLVSKDLMDLYTQVMGMIDTYVEIQKKMGMSDKLSPDDVKRILDLVGAPHTILFKGESSVKGKKCTLAEACTL